MKKKFELIFSILISLVFAVECQWHYEDQANWKRTYKECGGRAQSPININWDRATPNPSLDLKFHAYHKALRQYDVVNNDHSIQFTYTGKPKDAPALSGSAVKGNNFALAQFHFHWGLKNNHGSEHKIDGREYDMELHLVHFNRDKYANFDQAIASHKSGVVVLAVFYKVQKEKVWDLKLLSQIVTKLQNRGANDTFQVEVPITLNSFMPDQYGEDGAPIPFVKYEGSLTTPPCTEGVTWLLMGMPKHIGIKAMKSFRLVRNIHRMTAEGNNHRRVQPLNGRKIELFYC